MIMNIIQQMRQRECLLRLDVCEIEFVVGIEMGSTVWDGHLGVLLLRGRAKVSVGSEA